MQATPQSEVAVSGRSLGLDRVRNNVVEEHDSDNESASTEDVSGLVESEENEPTEDDDSGSDESRTSDRDTTETTTNEPVESDAESSTSLLSSVSRSSQVPPSLPPRRASIDSQASGSSRIEFSQRSLPRGANSVSSQQSTVLNDSSSEASSTGSNSQVSSSKGSTSTSRRSQASSKSSAMSKSSRGSILGSFLGSVRSQLPPLLPDEIVATLAPIAEDRDWSQHSEDTDMVSARSEGVNVDRPPVSARSEGVDIARLKHANEQSTDHAMPPDVARSRSARDDVKDRDELEKESDEEDDDEEDEDEDDDLVFESVSCGFQYTMLVAAAPEDRPAAGGKIWAMGSQRNGQLGIIRRKEDEDVLLCDICQVLIAEWDCDDCDFLEDKDRFQVFCKLCCDSIHAKRENRLHRRQRMNAMIPRYYFASPHLCKVPAPVASTARSKLGPSSSVSTSVAGSKSYAGPGSVSGRRSNASFAPGSSEEEEEEEEGEEDGDYKELDGIVQTSCGDSHTLIVDTNGLLYSCGSGGSGRTGLYWETDAVTEDRFYPTLVQSLTPRPEVHAPLVHGGGDEFCGSISSGGTGDDAGSMAEELENLVRMQTTRGSLAAGGAHSAVISTDGVCYTWGSNVAGQLGRALLDDGDDGEIPDWENDADGEFEGFHPLVDAYLRKAWQSMRDKEAGGQAMRRPTRLFDCGTLPKPVPYFVREKMTVLKVSCGDSHTLAMVAQPLAKNSWKGLFSWGRGKNFRLGHPPLKEGEEPRDEYEPRVIQALADVDDPEDISCGTAHSVVITEGGKVFSWGMNDSGQCGHPPYTPEKFAEIEAKLKVIAKDPATAKDPASALKEFCPAPEPVRLPREVKLPTEMQETVSKTADVGSYPDPKQGTILAKLAANDISTRLKAIAALDDWCRKHTPQARGKETKEAGKSKDSKGKGEQEGETEPGADLLTQRSRVSSRSKWSVRERGGNAGEEDASDLLTARSKQLTSRSRVSAKNEAQASRGGLMTARTGTTKASVPIDWDQQVACGMCHTLVLMDGVVWLLGSGLDLQPRASNLKVTKKVIKGKPEALLDTAECFVPRIVEVLLVDAAEVSCQTTIAYRDNVADQVIEDVVEESIPVLDEDGKPTEEVKMIFHRVLKITFDGDLAVEAGDEVSFKGPYAPPGLKLTDRSEGPYFRVLGLRGKDGRTKFPGGKHGQPLTEDELSPMTPLDSWHASLGPIPYKKKDPDDKKVGGTLWIEAPDDILKPDPKTKAISAAESVAWINRNITTNNERNMLVAKVSLIPKVKQIASGAFHACVLSEEGGVFIWGSGSKGRLGFGNEVRVTLAFAACPSMCQYCVFTRAFWGDLSQKLYILSNPRVLVSVVQIARAILTMHVHAHMYSCIYFHARTQSGSLVPTVLELSGDDNEWCIVSSKRRLMRD